MRIVGGRHRGLRLKAPADSRVRPTTDRVREALFNILVHRDPPAVAGAVVLDLFAGTGAVGLEALSRGASQAIFVDSDPRSLALVRENIAALKVGDMCRVVRADAARLGRAPVAADLVFLDAPYGRGLSRPALESAAAGGWMAPGATVAMELSPDETLDLPPLLVESDQRVYGGSKIIVARFEP
jgi:16S rRNA (guanine(966)-N(2))-methyltransferase RsmD